MSTTNLLPGITQHTLKTPRLTVAHLEAGSGDTPIVLIHGNCASSLFFQDFMLALAATHKYSVYAPDMRGFGDTDTLPVDATRGLSDFADDGSLVWPDAAGSGGGTANPEFVKRIAEGDRGSEQFSPRTVMNTFYFKPPFRAVPDREEIYVTSLLSTKVGPGNYPGDLTPSANWPNVAPGQQGQNNALSPKYMNQANFAKIHPQLPVLWIHGADDLIVSDTSLFDFGFLGQLGAVPGWPGAEVYPPQPMKLQIRAVLDAYKANGGQYREVMLADCGHSPHIEKLETVCELVHEHVLQNS